MDYKAIKQMAREIELEGPE
jgi:hypothetical protein